MKGYISKTAGTSSPVQSIHFELLKLESPSGPDFCISQVFPGLYESIILKTIKNTIKIFTDLKIRSIEVTKNGNYTLKHCCRI